MNALNFNEDDLKKAIEFLNMVAKHAKFEMSTQELIQYFKLLSHMQSQIVPKLEANILEIKRIVEAKTEVSQEAKKGE